MLVRLVLVILVFSINALAEKTYRFGVVPQQPMDKLLRIWVPMLQHWQEQSGVRLVFDSAPTIEQFQQRLAHGFFDFAYMNPYQYVLCQRINKYRVFAREKHRLITGIIVVSKNAKFKRLSELQGNTFAFPSPDAFAGSILPQLYLQKEQIPFKHQYVNSHDSVYKSVALGLYPAGGGILRTFNAMEMNVRKQLRILWQSNAYTPHALAHHVRVDRKVVNRILTIMEQMDAHELSLVLLSNANLSGFQKANNEDWDDIRMLMGSIP